MIWNKTRSAIYQISKMSRNLGIAEFFQFSLWTIHLLRQQKDWIGGSRKWPEASQFPEITFSAVFMLT